MIDFACICGERLSAPEDQAGGMLQCPRCNRLIDVPTLSDLKHLNTDGTYVIDETPIAEEPGRIASLTRAFASSRVDEDGNEIDLRNPSEPRRAAGYPRNGAPAGFAAPTEIDAEAPIELVEDEPAPRTAPPRYDPITGELIRAIDVTPNLAANPEIPMAKAVLGYAAPQVGVSGATSGLQICVEIFRPINAVVVLFVFLMHLFLSAVMFITLLVILPIVLAFAGLVLCLGHWSRVVEAMGPDEGDELPRPLGNFQFGEDI